MLIPSIDLMGGRIVQLVQGERLALEFIDIDVWVKRFAGYRLVQLIDLDAAKSEGENRKLVAHICGRLRCQVGGGIRSIEDARQLFALGAGRVIIGSALVRNEKADVDFARALAKQFGSERLVFAVDSRAGRVAVAGWRESTHLDPIDLMHALEPFCGAFLYTHIDTEGSMGGFPLEVAQRLRSETTRQLIVAGGVASADEIERLDEVGADAVVGMAIYTGQLHD